MVCSEKHCTSKVVAKKLCSKHYQRLKRGGKLETFCCIKDCDKRSYYKQKCLEHHEEMLKLFEQDLKRCPHCGEVKSHNQYTRPSQSAKFRAHCRECVSSKARQKHADNPDIERNRNLKRNFGINLDDYKTLFENQKGLCALCQKPERALSKKGNIVNLAVHHCHKTGKVLALCCFSCNMLMGYFKDDPILLRRAATICEGAYSGS